MKYSVSKEAVVLHVCQWGSALKHKNLVLSTAFDAVAAAAAAAAVAAAAAAAVVVE